MNAPYRSWNRGWWIPASVGLALVVTAIATAFLSPDGVQAARFVVRLTARTSLLLFLLAFTASALVRIAPGTVTSWIRAHRRFIGVGFAVSHIVHAAALAALARLDFATFLQLTTVASYVAGGLTYAFILAMAATSFDGAVTLLGARSWRLLHLVGGWYIWISFALNFGKRVPGDPVYLLPVALLTTSAILRIYAGWCRRASDRAGAAYTATPYRS